MPESQSTGEFKWGRRKVSDYINWISQSSRKQATFSPSTNIEIGDYGVIDEETKEFQRRGNIFQDREILGIIPELATDVWKLRTTLEEDKLVITHHMEMTDLGPNEDAELRLQFEGGGEFLVTYRPRIVDTSQPIDLTKLSKIQKLAGMRLVTGTVTCPAYALFYWTRFFNSEIVSVSLNHSVRAIFAKLRVKQGWTWGMDGLYKVGYNSHGIHEYTPLFSLTEILDKSDNIKDAQGQTVPLVDLIKLRLPIPAPSAGDGNEIFKSGVIGVAPWLSGKSKRPDKWKNRPAAPSDPIGNSANHGESIHIVDLSEPVPRSTTTPMGPITRSNQASGAADQTRVYYSRMPENHGSGCFLSCCWCQ